MGELNNQLGAVTSTKRAIQAVCTIFAVTTLNIPQRARLNYWTNVNMKIQKYRFFVVKLFSGRTQLALADVPVSDGF